MVAHLWGSGVFWFTIVLLPVFCMSRDFAWKSYKRFARPEPYHIVQEIQKYMTLSADFYLQFLTSYFFRQAQSTRLSATKNAVFTSHQKDSRTAENTAESWICILANRRKSREDYSSLRYNSAEVVRSLIVQKFRCPYRSRSCISLVISNVDVKFILNTLTAGDRRSKIFSG